MKRINALWTVLTCAFTNLVVFFLYEVRTGVDTDRESCAVSLLLNAEVEASKVARVLNRNRISEDMLLRRLTCV
jgi:hypothetical protein